MKSSVTVRPHAPSVGASNMLPKFTPRPRAAAVAVALADARGGASFAIGGNAAMSGPVCGAGTAVALVPVQALRRSGALASSAARTIVERFLLTERGNAVRDAARDRRAIRFTWVHAPASRAASIGR